MLPIDCKKLFSIAKDHSSLPNKNLRNWGFSGNECWLHFDSFHMPNVEEAFILALEKFLIDKELKGFKMLSAPPKLKINIIILEFN